MGGVEKCLYKLVEDEQVKNNELVCDCGGDLRVVLYEGY